MPGVDAVCGAGLGLLVRPSVCCSGGVADARWVEISFNVTVEEDVIIDVLVDWFGPREEIAVGTYFWDGEISVHVADGRCLIWLLKEVDPLNPGEIEEGYPPLWWVKIGSVIKEIVNV